MARALLVLVVAAALALIGASAVDAYEAKGFIKTCKGRFADSEGKMWTFAGWNGYTTLINDAYRHLYQGAPDKVDFRFRQAKNAGLTAVRIWAHGDGTFTVLQPSAGQYNEKVFRALDYVIFKARQYNIRVLASLTTYWQDKDGIIGFARFAGLTYRQKNSSPYYTEQWAAKDKFWTSSKAKSLYKAHMRKMFTRKNTFNSIAYKDDYAIFAWGLFNEPRCPASQASKACTGRITNWANEMYKHAKSQNKKQLLTFGEEGFFAKNGYLGQKEGSKWYVGCNPSGIPGNVQKGWAASVGQDFTAQHKYADFLEFHLWPVNWNTKSTAFAEKWINCHLKACERVGKPCVLGEFGRALGSGEGKAGAIAGTRNPYFKTVFTTVRNRVRNYDPMGGDMWWQWVDDGTPVGPGSNNAIRTTDSTFREFIVWGVVACSYVLCRKLPLYFFLRAGKPLANLPFMSATAADS